MHRPYGTHGVTRTLRIRQAGPSQFDIIDDDAGLMGSAINEAKAVVSAMFSADALGDQGLSVRVVADRGGLMEEEVYAVRRTLP